MSNIKTPIKNLESFEKSKKISVFEINILNFISQYLIILGIIFLSGLIIRYITIMQINKLDISISEMNSNIDDINKKIQDKQKIYDEIKTIIQNQDIIIDNKYYILNDNPDAKKIANQLIQRLQNQNILQNVKIIINRNNNIGDREYINNIMQNFNGFDINKEMFLYQQIIITFNGLFEDDSYRLLGLLREILPGYITVQEISITPSTKQFSNILFDLKFKKYVPKFSKPLKNRLSHKLILNWLLIKNI